MLEISYSEWLKIRKKDYKINSFYVKINTVTAQTMLLTKLVDVKKICINVKYGKKRKHCSHKSIIP